MAQYFEDFRSGILDSTPSDFSLVWGGPLAFAIKSGNPLPDSDRHLLLTPSDGGFTRTALKWLSENTSGRTTVRVLLQCQFQNEIAQAVHIPGPFLSGSGNSASRTGYVFWSGQSDRISKYNGGSDSTLATGGSAGTAALVDRWLEIIRDGGKVEVRRWLFGEERPSTANAEITDGAPLAVAGFFGLSFLSSTANTPGKLYSIAAATDGDAIPTAPITGGVTLSVDSMSLSMTMNSSTLTQANQLTVDDIQLQLSLDAVTLQQANVLSPDDISLNSFINAITLSSAGQLSVDSLQLNIGLVPVELQQSNVLAVNGLLLSTNFESTDLSVGLNLVPDSIWLSALLDQVAITQSHLLTVDDLSQSISLDNVNLTIAGQVIGPGTLTIGITGPSISIGISQ